MRIAAGLLIACLMFMPATGNACEPSQCSDSVAKLATAHAIYNPDIRYEIQQDLNKYFAAKTAKQPAILGGNGAMAVKDALDAYNEREKTALHIEHIVIVATRVPVRVPGSEPHRNLYGFELQFLVPCKK